MMRIAWLVLVGLQIAAAAVPDATSAPAEPTSAPADATSAPADATSAPADATTSESGMIDKDASAAEVTGVNMNAPGDLDAFITALLMNSLIVGGCLLGFTVLRFYFPLMYCPQHEAAKAATGKVSAKDADALGSSESTAEGTEARLPSHSSKASKFKIFDWVWTSIFTTTEDAMDTAGLDAALLRDFCTLGAQVLAMVGFPMCLIMIPINNTQGDQDLGADNELSSLEMATIRDGHPWLYYVHAVLVWLVCIGVHFLLDRAQARFLKLRVQWLQSMPAPRSTTVLVENIPKQWRSDDLLREFFGKIFSPQDVLGAHMVKREDDLAKLVIKRDKLVAMKRKAELTLQKKETRETFRPNCCAKKVDTLEYCEDQMQGLDEQIVALREEHEIRRQQDPTCGSSHCGFVTFKGRRFAEMAKDLHISACKQEWQVSEAPVPEDLRWGDLRKSREFRICMEVLGHLCVLALYIGFIPIVAFVTNLAMLVNLGPLQPLWAGFAPTLGLTLFVSLLPMVLSSIFRTFFVLKADALSQHKLQFWYFLFQLIFVVLVTTVGKSLFAQFQRILLEPASVLSIMAESLPYASHFYMTYLVLQWSRHAMEALRYSPFAKFLVFRVIFSPQEAKQMSEPEDQDSFGFGARNVNLAVNVVLGLLFCSLSPLVTLLAMIDLLLSRLVYGYLVIYAETKKPDLGGVFWATQVHFIQLALVLYSILMVGVIMARSDTRAWVVVAPTILFLIWSFLHLNKAYQWETLPFQEVAFNCEEILDHQSTSDLTGECYIQPELAKVSAITQSA
eukprot:CAMPEP_0181426588 /NCGR_PEP_ID=MMETSP1110-20121109/15739_1 /TAXON_ID=174948 /ORGANISM="Symbiodinium sp., Strain CCMP421" /LENGTH=789 /DNA_ID=CAMNT_0023549785 /DNA_START=47 /DNA_END=2416 /DNA_ORIENTATION=+